MSHQGSQHTCCIPRPFHAALKLVRSAVTEAGLSITGELPVPAYLALENQARQPSRILQVDAPLLDFQGLALDSELAIFIPIHILVSAQGSQTRVSWEDPVAALGAWLPASAAVPMRELQSQIARAVAPLGQPGSQWHPAESGSAA